MAAGHILSLDTKARENKRVRTRSTINNSERSDWAVAASQGRHVHRSHHGLADVIAHPRLPVSQGFFSVTNLADLGAAEASVTRDKTAQNDPRFRLN